MLLELQMIKENFNWFGIKKRRSTHINIYLLGNEVRGPHVTSIARDFRDLKKVANVKVESARKCKLMQKMAAMSRAGTVAQMCECKEFCSVYYLLIVEKQWRALAGSESVGQGCAGLVTQCRAPKFAGLPVANLTR